jgi:hypothetical protein
VRAVELFLKPAAVAQNGKGHAAFATRPLFKPATTYSPTHVWRRRPTLPHTCGAGALARERPSPGTDPFSLGKEIAPCSSVTDIKKYEV